MAVSEEAFDLLIWETPFMGAVSPSVSVIPDPDCLGTITVAVAPHGIDSYPKYLVRFDAAAAFKCQDESVAPTMSFKCLKRDQPRSCTYFWQTSLWANEFEETREIVDLYYSGKLKHYVLLGGDTIAEILASEDPRIEEVTGPRVVVTYEV